MARCIVELRTRTYSVPAIGVLDELRVSAALYDAPCVKNQDLFILTNDRINDVCVDECKCPVSLWDTRFKCSEHQTVFMSFSCGVQVVRLRNAECTSVQHLVRRNRCAQARSHHQRRGDRWRRSGGEIRGPAAVSAFSSVKQFLDHSALGAGIKRTCAVVKDQ